MPNKNGFTKIFYLDIEYRLVLMQTTLFHFFFLLSQPDCQTKVNLRVHKTLILSFLFPTVILVMITLHKMFSYVLDSYRVL